jgi:hypothetical protein
MLSDRHLEAGGRTGCVDDQRKGLESKSLDQSLERVGHTFEPSAADQRGSGEPEAGQVDRDASVLAPENAERVTPHEGRHRASVKKQERSPLAFVDIVEAGSTRGDESTLEREQGG